MTKLFFLEDLSNSGFIALYEGPCMCADDYTPDTKGNAVQTRSLHIHVGMLAAPLGEMKLAN